MNRTLALKARIALRSVWIIITSKDYAKKVAADFADYTDIFLYFFVKKEKFPLITLSAKSAQSAANKP